MILTIFFAVRRPAKPVVTCHIQIVSYRFVGQPGTTFDYDGDAWRIPMSGDIELLASTATTYECGGKSLPIDAGPLDDFGTRTVPLPRKQLPVPQRSTP
jgi:hypothetical protein